MPLVRPFGKRSVNRDKNAEKTASTPGRSGLFLIHAFYPPLHGKERCCLYHLGIAFPITLEAAQSS